ncbi:MAG: hypothetical protein HQ536_01605 [Parcubacteria group bacterium]|nr:hypothetical protein [Parcubacteria group bacterium]
MKLAKCFTLPHFCLAYLLRESFKCHCEECERRGNLKKRDCFTSFAMTKWRFLDKKENGI